MTGAGPRGLLLLISRLRTTGVLTAVSALATALLLPSRLRRRPGGRPGAPRRSARPDGPSPTEPGGVAIHRAGPTGG